MNMNLIKSLYQKEIILILFRRSLGQNWLYYYVSSTEVWKKDWFDILSKYLLNENMYDSFSYAAVSILKLGGT